MTPKKRSKDVASSSSSAPFDMRKFWDAQAAENYTVMMDRPNRERGWSLFIKTSSDAVCPLVRELYANLKVKHDNMRV